MVSDTMWWHWPGAPPQTCPCWRCTSVAPVTPAFVPRWAGPFPSATWLTRPKSVSESSATSPEVRPRVAAVRWCVCEVQGEEGRKQWGGKVRSNDWRRDVWMWTFDHEHERWNIRGWEISFSCKRFSLIYDIRCCCGSLAFRVLVVRSVIFIIWNMKIYTLNNDYPDSQSIMIDSQPNLSFGSLSKRPMSHKNGILGRMQKSMHEEKKGYKSTVSRDKQTQIFHF